jgi:hypothetical protein
MQSLDRFVKLENKGTQDLMLKLLIERKQVTTSVGVTYYATLEDGTVPDRFHSHSGMFADPKDVAIRVQPFTPDSCTSTSTDWEEVEVEWGDEFDSEMPRDMRWFVQLKPNLPPAKMLRRRRLRKEDLSQHTIDAFLRRIGVVLKDNEEIDDIPVAYRNIGKDGTQSDWINGVCNISFLAGKLSSISFDNSSPAQLTSYTDGLLTLSDGSNYELGVEPLPVVEWAKILRLLQRYEELVANPSGWLSTPAIALQSDGRSGFVDVGSDFYYFNSLDEAISFLEAAIDQGTHNPIINPHGQSLR